MGSAKSSTNSSAIGASDYFFRQYWNCVKLMENILLWSNILSLKTEIDLAIDGLFNRYILSALRQMDLKSNEMLTRCFYLVQTFPIEKWIDTSTQSTTLPALEHFCSFLNQLAGEYSEQYFISNDKEKKIFQENLRQVRTIFLRLNAKDRAMDLSNQYEMK